MIMATKKRPREEESAWAHEPNMADKAVSAPSAKKLKHRRQGQSRSDENQRPGPGSEPGNARHALLSQYYTRLWTLRDYLLANLPPSSRIRRRKLASIGKPDLARGKPAVSDLELSVAKLLDSTLVGASQENQPRSDARWDQWASFSQRGDESYVSLSDGVARALLCQSEVVNFVIWSLFEREKKPGTWPKNVVCDGYRRSPITRARGGGGIPAADIVPGLFCAHPNQRAQALRSSPWPELLSLLGQSGERMMIDLLLDHSVFAAISSGIGNFYQLSGNPINDLEPLPSNQDVKQRPVSGKSPAEISFVRSRMLYSRAALNARGKVHFGLRHIHVLNRHPFLPQESVSPGDVAVRRSPDELDDRETKNSRNTVHCMMYLFPRQFGLHNAFTSTVDRARTAQAFQDYTLREEEIQKRFPGGGALNPSRRLAIPRRLRGAAFHLVQRLQILQSRCSYSALLQHYCPSPCSRWGVSQGRRNGQEITPRPSSLVDLTTPAAQVSAYCRAVLSKIIPDGFWGSGQAQAYNQRVVLKHVDHFILLRRFESMTLHDVAQGLKVTEIDWLAPPGLAKGQAMSQTDARKRTEIFLEFLYYVFDSLLIPLVRSNFYVTESNNHRMRLFYFRHDVWRQIAEPEMARLKLRMFEEVPTDQAKRVLGSRELGFSQVRLLPKQSTVRPITNLRRRTLKKASGQALTPSINTILGPVHSVLKYEKNHRPLRLGAAMFSVGDIYSRLKEFKARMLPSNRRFYFAKVDVQAAFDTIPQSAIVRLMREIPSHGHYRVVKHVEVRCDPFSGRLRGAAKKATRRWCSTAQSTGSSSTFLEMLAGSGAAAIRRDTVFLDGVAQKTYDIATLMGLMTTHIRQNLVRIGKKFYRQSRGIPQGSILSSLLCNYFYADLETQHLAFLRRGDEGDYLLLRMIDDFLLITTDRSKASRFIDVMHAGVPEFGVTVSAGKSLVNFDMTCAGVDAAVPKLSPDAQGFPYCGTLLDCNTLDITKDRSHIKDLAVSNSLTVDFSRRPGHSFQRKTLNSFKIQSHVMFFDTSHNSRKTAMRNLFGAMSETATKMWVYIRCLPKAKQPGHGLVINTINSLVDLAYSLLTSKARHLGSPGYTCSIRKEHVKWITLHAFHHVLAKRQANHGELLKWLRCETQKMRHKNRLPPDDGMVNA